MSNDLEPKSETQELSDEALAAIEKHYARMRDFAASLPSFTPIAKNLLHYYAVHIDENGKMEPDQDGVNTQYLAAILALETRVARLENALTVAGIDIPKLTAKD